uniref:Amidohydrolase-related domain-containing protein n=1 Tax=Kalanchoe fedtschenkoi TaxID=63787 RepID=A0A7N0U9Z4_KALFE
MSLMALRLITNPSILTHTSSLRLHHCSPLPLSPKKPSTTIAPATSSMATTERIPIVIDSHLHVWAAPQEAAQKYPYFPGQEPTLPGNVDLLIECMEEAGVDGALIVQPINHKFDHSYVTSVIRKYPAKFIGCCLANPANDGSGVGELERLILKDGYRAVRFNPYLWPSDEKMTNEIGRSMFSKAGELGVPVGFMCMKGLNLHISEIEQLLTDYPSTTVLLDHLAFCKPPVNEEDHHILSSLLNLSRFPQVYVKFSALFRVSRQPPPYLDLSDLLSQVVSNFGAHRVMWGSDFPFVLSECGYKGGKEAVEQIANQISLSQSEKEWIMGKTMARLFKSPWHEA